MSQFAIKGINHYFTKVKYDPDPFPVKVGDEVVVKITCEWIQKDSYIIAVEPPQCPFLDQCNFDRCVPENEFEVATVVETIFDRGQGWTVVFAGLTVEACLSDFGTSFWKKVGE